MDEVECLDRVSRVDDTRDVDLVRALADHLDVDLSVAQGCEHAPGNADHIPHSLADERQNSHVSTDGDLARKLISRHHHEARRD